MYTINAGDLTIVLNAQGEITSLLGEGTDYAKGESVPVAAFIKLVMAEVGKQSNGPTRKDGVEIKPIELERINDNLIFRFENGIEVEVAIVEKEKYTTFAITRFDKKDLDVELLMWGPITTHIKENFGETLGVVYNNQFAIGMRGLNDKTQLTVPFEYAGHVVGEERRLNVSYTQDRSRFKGRVSALDCCGASPTEWGSVLQAFTYDATKDRIRLVNFVGEKRIPALEGQDAQVVGSAIAIYGVAFNEKTPKQAVLDTIEVLEIEEGLPHPLIDGEWQKKTPKATKPYMILGDLNEQTIEKASQYANRADIDYVYRDSMFTSNGSYQFVGGDEAMKEMVQRAAQYNVKVGSHSLSGFIDYGDFYTKKENKGQFAGEPLAKLIQSVEAGGNELFVSNEWKNIGKTKQIGDELIEVLESVAYDEGYKIILKAPVQHNHSAGEVIWGLHNNQYGGIAAGVEQTREIATRLATACNHTGMSQISFDGVEIGEYNGYSHYSVNQMINGFYNQLTKNIQESIISDSSGGYPNAWHTNTRQNWGEPWGAQMREGMIDYRYDNQLYFDRNFTPKMLGWFIYHEGQPTIDIEWMLAKSAGFDAGYALVSSTNTFDQNGNTPQVLEAIKEWQKARACKAFTKDQMQRLLDTKKDWHLETTEVENVWKLYCINYPNHPIEKFYDGESQTCDYFNPYHTQPLHLEVQAKNGPIEQFIMTIDGANSVFNKVIPEKGYLVYKGTDTAMIYDERWNIIEVFAIQMTHPLMVTKGTQKITFDFKAEHTAVQAALRILTQDYPEDVFVGNTVTDREETLENVLLSEQEQVEDGVTTAVITYKGTAPILPTVVRDRRNDIGFAYVTWEDIPEYSYQEVGRFQVKGKINDTQSKVFANVIVTNKPLANLTGGDRVNLTNTENITLQYGLTGDTKVSEHVLEIYFDKELFAFDKQGQGIKLKDHYTRLKDFSVNNESAIIAIKLESDQELAKVDQVLELTFTAKKEGVGDIVLKYVGVTKGDTLEEITGNTRTIGVCKAY